MTIIFDDMGSLALERERLDWIWHKTGAFVRLDDLDPSYAFGHLDRSILMSPHRQNARVVIPLTEYKDVVAGCPVDLLLYANNYEPVDEELPAVELFDNPEQALHIFRSGYRAAKGTTDEQGLVRSYFANPFGPSQMRELHEGIAQRYFEEIYRLGVPVGQLRTRLGIAGWEREGPRRLPKRCISRLQSQAGRDGTRSCSQPQKRYIGGLTVRVCLRAAQALTLVEVLVVIAIIVVLARPTCCRSTKQCLKKAESASCLSNLRSSTGRCGDVRG